MLRVSDEWRTCPGYVNPRLCYFNRTGWASDVHSYLTVSAACSLTLRRRYRQSYLDRGYLAMRSSGMHGVLPFGWSNGTVRLHHYAHALYRT